MVQLRGQFMCVQEKFQMIDSWVRDYRLPTYTHFSRLFMYIVITVGSMTFKASKSIYIYICVCVCVNGVVCNCIQESDCQTEVETVVFA